MRKPEPHELAGAKSWVRSINGPPWDKLTPELQRGAIAKARRILRASGRGGKELLRETVCLKDGLSYVGSAGCGDCETCTRHTALLLDLGPARMRRTRNG